MSAVAWSVLSVVLTVNSPYVRSHTSKDSGAHCLWWGETNLAFAQNVVGNPTTGASAFNAVTTGFLTWQETMKQCGNLSLTESPRSTSRKVGVDASGGPNTNLVLFRYSTCTKKVAASNPCWAAGTCANDYDCWDHSAALLGMTTLSYNTTSGRILDADIELDAADNVFTTVDLPVCTAKLSQTCIAADVQNTVTHEIGHFLGLDHTDAARSTMNATASLGETSKRVIDPGTVAFVCAVYAKGLATKDCVMDPIEQALGAPAVVTGCSSTGAWGGWVLVVVLVAALRKRVRLGLVLGVLATAVQAQATTMVGLDVDSLTSTSDLVARATVRQVSARWSADHARIFTEVQLEVTEVWKGVASSRTLVATQPGGEVGEVGQRVEGIARFEPGEEVVVFLEARGPRFTVTGYQQGKFRLERAVDGLVYASQAGSEALYVDALTRQPIERQPLRMSVADLKRTVTNAGLQSLPSVGAASP
jgi:hypothetical protein